MISKIFALPAAALADVPDGATILVGGFGSAGMPAELIEALIAQGAKDLTVVSNNAGNGDTGLAALIAANRVRKILSPSRSRWTPGISSALGAPAG